MSNQISAPELSNGDIFIGVVIAMTLAFISIYVLWRLIKFIIKITIMLAEKIRNTTIDNILKYSVILGTIVFSLSVAYYLIYRPMTRQNYTKVCNKEAFDNSRKESNDKNKKIKYEEIFQRCLRDKGL